MCAMARRTTRDIRHAVEACNAVERRFEPLHRRRGHGGVTEQIGVVVATRAGQRDAVSRSRSRHPGRPAAPCGCRGTTRRSGRDRPRRPRRGRVSSPDRPRAGLGDSGRRRSARPWRSPARHDRRERGANRSDGIRRTTGRRGRLEAAPWRARWASPRKRGPRPPGRGQPRLRARAGAGVRRPGAHPCGRPCAGGLRVPHASSSFSCGRRKQVLRLDRKLLQLIIFHSAGRMREGRSLPILPIGVAPHPTARPYRLHFENLTVIPQVLLRRNTR